MRATAHPRRFPSHCISSNGRLALALLVALAGCLNPRPEDYPSSNDTPAAASGPADSSRQAPGFNGNVAEDGPSAANPGAQEPGPESPARPEAAPPSSLVPEEPADAGADAAAASADSGAGEAGDAGAPAVAE